MQPGLLYQVYEYLARLGLALRADGTGEPDSNFLQIVKCIGGDELDGKLKEWMKRKSNRYTSHEIQIMQNCRLWQCKYCSISPQISSQPSSQ